MTDPKPSPQEHHEWARELIAHAVELMTPEQIGQWEGVRAWQETFPDDASPHPQPLGVDPGAAAWAELSEHERGRLSAFSEAAEYFKARDMESPCVAMLWLASGQVSELGADTAADYKRARACVSALEGIEDPDSFRTTCENLLYAHTEVTAMAEIEGGPPWEEANACFRLFERSWLELSTALGAPGKPQMAAQPPAVAELREAALECVEAVRKGAEIYRESQAMWEWQCADRSCRAPTRSSDQVTEHRADCRVAKLERLAKLEARDER